ncbi:low molecular weight protein tyrosine phosphatase family protein [Zooshikella sp. RANM57]|uniref:low molecular weight protein tyrosine phosphatase family protein n=1 Tax=Zooshikella sp. RANM57 TaxID=3425863 RepID=UPI003D6FE6E8
MTKPVNLLFICSRNQWRSPTAEAIWKNDPLFKVRSAGTSPRAKRTVSPVDIRWADVIFVMEKKHKNRLQAAFARLLEHKPVYVLDIPDDYQYMDPELIAELEERVNDLLSKQEIDAELKSFPSSENEVLQVIR